MTPADTAYWLLLGDTPAGPFPLAAVHAKLASGEATWDTRACPVGAGVWLPLRQTPGVGPADPAPPLPGPTPAATAADVFDGTPSRRAAAPQARRPGRWVAVAAGIIAVVAVITFAAGRSSPPTDPAGRDLDFVPAEYRPFLRDGKQVPTGDATLDYWVNINLSVALARSGNDPLSEPILLRGAGEGIRGRPAAGVDPDLVAWVHQVAALLEAQAGLSERLTAAGLAIRPGASRKVQATVDELDHLVTAWEADRDRLVREGERLRAALAARHGRPFPPALV